MFLIVVVVVDTVGGHGSVLMAQYTLIKDLGLLLLSSYIVLFCNLISVMYAGLLD